MNLARLLLWAAFASVVLGPSFAAAQHQAVSQMGDDITPTPEESSSPWGWLKVPSVSMPKVNWPKIPADPLAPIKSSARKVSDGGKKAWEGTKEIFTGGAKNEQPAARVATAGESPTMWERLVGKKQEEPQGPQTVKEWMSQPRVGEN